jgi:hypothetical protein
LLPFTVPQWVPYLCDAPMMCDPSHEGAAECSLDCIPGESVCETTVGGDGDSVMLCNANGEWEPAQDCNTGGAKAQTCYTKYPEHAGAREAMCVDPVCDYIWNAFGAFADEFGICEGDQVRRCNDEGQVVDADDASECADGVCLDWTTIENNPVGRCQSECEDGDTVCVDADTNAEEQYGGALAASPFYLECQGGIWNLEVHSCAGDALCFGTRASSTATEGSSVICGGECVPGWASTATALPASTQNAGSLAFPVRSSATSIKTWRRPRLQRVVTRAPTAISKPALLPPMIATSTSVATSASVKIWRLLAALRWIRSVRSTARS